MIQAISRTSKSKPETLKELLIEGARCLEIELDESQVESLLLYQSLLLDWNKRENLTAIREPKEVIIKHLLDSLTCLSVIPFSLETRLIDIGSGAGLPGLPIKICWSEIRVSLLDSLRKRIIFLKEAKERLNLPDVEILCGRAEIYGHSEEYRERFDLAVCRAVGGLSTLVELALPFLKTGGVFIAMKGPKAEEEIPQAERAIKLLNGRLQEVKHLVLPFTGDKRILILIEKQGPSPTEYPRRPGLPRKRPL